jgi:hypothetical protein
MNSRTHAPHTAHPASQPAPEQVHFHRRRTEREQEIGLLQEETDLSLERLYLFVDATLLYLQEDDKSPRASQIGTHLVLGLQDLQDCIASERNVFVNESEGKTL